MSSTPQSPPPGWYPQEGGQRYWDGRAWTDAVAPPGSAYVQAPDAVPKKKPIYKRFWFIALVAVLLIVGVTQAVSGGSEPPRTAGASNSPAASTTPRGTKPPKSAGVGSAVRDGKFQFTVTKVAPGRSRVGSSDFGKKAQGQFILVSVTVKNIGNEAQSLLGDYQYLFDKQGNRFSADTEAAIYVENSQTLYEEINPGNSLKGTIIFDVPKNVAPAKLELHDSPFSDGVDVRLA